MANHTKRLNSLTVELVKLEAKKKALEEEISPMRDELKALMEEGKLDEHTAPDGSVAKLTAQTNYDWDVAQLTKALPSAQHDSFMPRKPDSSKLRKLLEVGTQDLSKCYTESTIHRLSVRAAA